MPAATKTEDQVDEKLNWGEPERAPHQWRSQSAADASAQHGHTKFASSLVPRLRPASPLAVP